MWHLIFIAFLPYAQVNMSQLGDYSSKDSCLEQAERFNDKLNELYPHRTKDYFKKQFVCVKDVEE